MDVFIIGGGAAGLTSAIRAKQKGYDVTILERNNKCGKKLLLTGNGRCNYWNNNQSINNYHSNNLHNLEIIYEQMNKKVLPFFDFLGIVPKIINGYYYPSSNQSTSILNALVNTALNLEVKIITDTYVENIIKDNKFTIITNNKTYQADKIIIATGSCAYPKTGSDGNGYNLALNLGHSLNPILPSLVKLIGNDSFYKDWDKVRCDVTLSLYENDQFIKSENGEAQFTDYGLSGIAAFNLSGDISRGLNKKYKEEIFINFVPWYNEKEPFLNWLIKENAKVTNYTVSQLLEGFLNYKIVNLIIKLMHIKENAHLKDINQEKLVDLLTHFKVTIVGTKDFNEAQVTTGGIPLDEINPQTMESLIVKGLYFTGEILDVDGICGGYNLGFAWMSALLAGELND